MAHAFSPLLRRALTTSTVLLAAVAGAWPAVGAEVVLGRRAAVLEMEAADVTVTISDEPARLVSAPLDPEAPDDSQLDVSFDGQSVRIRRQPAPPGQRGPRPRIQVSLWIGPAQRLSLVGSDLDVRVTGLPAPGLDESLAIDSADDEDDENEDQPVARQTVARQTTPSAPHDPASAPLLEIGVVDSTVNLDQTADTTLALAGSRLRAEGTHGTLSVVAESGSEAELVRHRGSIMLEATFSDAVVVEAEATVEAILDTANLLLRDGRGMVNARARGGLLVIERWQGLETLRGNATTIELREVGSRTTVTGSALLLTAENGRGILTVTSDQGGAIRIADWLGRTTVDLSGGGTLDAHGLKAPLTVVLAQGARGDVSDIGSLADITLRDAELTLKGARSLKLQATDAVAVMTGIGRLDQVAAERSRLDLDLTEARTIGRVVADRGCHLTLALREPCRVIVAGTAGRGGGEEVDANRCFVHLEGAPTAGKPYVPRERGRASIVRVELEAGGRLTATGHAPP